MSHEQHPSCGVLGVPMEDALQVRAALRAAAFSAMASLRHTVLSSISTRPFVCLSTASERSSRRCSSAEKKDIHKSNILFLTYRFRRPYI